MSNKSKITILIPCLNEEKAISQCVIDIEKYIEKKYSNLEVIMIDNASTDETKNLINKYQVDKKYIKYIYESKRGYGSAYLSGINNTTGEILVMIDADCTYHFGDIPKMINLLVSEELDMVIGNRFIDKDNIKKTMPFMNRYVGNPVLSFITKLFFKLKINDIHCGLRVIRKNSLDELQLNTTGMEFASEMIVKAAKRGMSISELPVNYRNRVGVSKLNPFRDGWRHLAFLLVQSPFYLFVVPGLTMFLLGLVFSLILLSTKITIFGLDFYIQPIFIFSLLMILGYQIFFFGIFGKVYAVTHLGDDEKGISGLFKYLPLKRIIYLSLVVIFLGVLAFVLIFMKWISIGFGDIDLIKESVFALTMIAIGVQTLFSSFMMSVLGIKY